MYNARILYCIITFLGGAFSVNGAEIDSAWIDFHHRNKVGDVFNFEKESTIREQITLDMPQKMKHGERNIERTYSGSATGNFVVDSVNAVGNPVLMTVTFSQGELKRDEKKLPIPGVLNAPILLNLTQKVPQFKRKDGLTLSNAEFGFISLFFRPMGNTTANDLLGPNRYVRDNLKWCPPTDTPMRLMLHQKEGINPKDYASRAGAQRVNEKDFTGWRIDYALRNTQDKAPYALEYTMRFLLKDGQYNHYRMQSKNVITTRSDHVPSGNLLPPNAKIIETTEILNFATYTRQK